MIFVVVMSHDGFNKPDSVLTDDLTEIDAWNDIIYPLGDNDELRHVPKIFLFNMCRYSWEGGPWNPPKEEPPEDESDPAYCKHSLSDALLLFTTLPYDGSRRDAEN